MAFASLILITTRGYWRTAGCIKPPITYCVEGNIYLSPLAVSPAPRGWNFLNYYLTICAMVLFVAFSLWCEFSWRSLGCNRWVAVVGESGRRSFAVRWCSYYNMCGLVVFVQLSWWGFSWRSLVVVVGEFGCRISGPLMLVLRIYDSSTESCT